MALSLDIPHRLRKLGTPISSHFPLACASSTSFLVGATRSWRVRLEAPSSNVLSMLITICAKASARLTMAQSPWYNSTTPSDVVPKCSHAQVATEKLVRHTEEAATRQLHRTTSRRAFQVRHDFARGCSGLTAGNQGSNNFTDPYMPGTESIGDTIEGKSCCSHNLSWSGIFDEFSSYAKTFAKIGASEAPRLRSGDETWELTSFGWSSTAAMINWSEGLQVKWVSLNRETLCSMAKLLDQTSGCSCSVTPPYSKLCYDL